MFQHFVVFCVVFTAAILVAVVFGALAHVLIFIHDSIRDLLNRR